MQIYLSHSYRDVSINAHFFEQFDDEGITLHLDQKTEVWCVAKLERYFNDMTGVVSIIPNRPTETSPVAYSAFIGQELNLARRARVPLLLFVDEQVLKQHELDFPETAVPFRSEALKEESGRHADAIRGFWRAIETRYRDRRAFRPNEAALVCGEGRSLRDAADDVGEILRRRGFSVNRVTGQHQERGLDDIRLLEALWRAELCVFLLSERLSDTHIALAMAHANFLPSIRLQYDKRAEKTEPSLSGVIRWQSAGAMLSQFGLQLDSYQTGLVQPRDISTDAREAARGAGTMKRRFREEEVWAVEDGAALAQHVYPSHRFVRDEVGRVAKQIAKPLGRIRDREGTMEVCGLLYDGLKRLRFGYEREQPTGIPGTQAVRSPTQIETHGTATCVDLACLFAALLEAAYQSPLIVVLEGKGFSHALAGYRVWGEPTWDQPGIGALRSGLQLGDIVLFEATGAVEADEPVGAETTSERVGKVLVFRDAIAAARRAVARRDVRLKHLVDIVQARGTLQ